MSEFITLNSENFDATKYLVKEVLQNSGIAVLAAEHGYMYVCDAFSPLTIGKVHQIRRTDPATASQVMVGKIEMAKGVAVDLDGEFLKLADSFWPGLLTMQLSPQPGLSWDLGDGGALAEFALRIPSSAFLLAVLQEFGPVAVASASVFGRAATTNINYVPAIASDIGIYVDEGILQAGPASTVIRQQVIGTSNGLEIIREGALSLADLQAVSSGICLATE